MIIGSSRLGQAHHHRSSLARQKYQLQKAYRRNRAHFFLQYLLNTVFCSLNYHDLMLVLQPAERSFNVSIRNRRGDDTEKIAAAAVVVALH